MGGWAVGRRSYSKVSEVNWDETARWSRHCEAAGQVPNQQTIIFLFIFVTKNGIVLLVPWQSMGIGGAEKTTMGLVVGPWARSQLVGKTESFVVIFLRETKNILYLSHCYLRPTQRWRRHWNSCSERRANDICKSPSSHGDELLGHSCATVCGSLPH